MNGKILFANLLTEIPIVMLVVGMILLIAGRRHGSSPVRFWIGAFLTAFPIGLIAYIVSGILAASMRGDGHWYSVPFGGYAVDNPPIVASFCVWLALSFVLVTLVAKK